MIEFLQRLENEAEEKKTELSEASCIWDEVRQKTEEMKAEAQIERDKISAIAVVLQVLSEGPETLLSTVVSDEQYKRIVDLVKPYEYRLKLVIDDLCSFKAKEGELKIAKANLEEAERNVPAAEDKQMVSDTKKTLENLHFQNIQDHVFEETMKAVAKKYGVKKNKQTQFRYELYLILAFCTIVFKKPNLNDNFLNIDEAQDLAVTEYAVLRAVLGSGCVFNLYGDVNQLVYDYKGIRDWDDISDITGGKLYVLNENYRNTLQVTDYCNKAFRTEVYPIGVSGVEVEELPLEEALDKFRTEVRGNPYARSAVLIANGNHNMREHISSICGFRFLEQTSAEVSVLTVEMAKGLEFERVLVVEAGMSEHERYISFTRALERLIVAKGSL